ncbi:hypothetical protein HETIRDRAFT_331192 [Heterobasidion irregulare TC 32-1]|uniref:Uncharacterized protein n=1 Tax=Heterobasidion irregulare (strain TC 32-1) TaxID=747525 RepID=W4JR32_HETIT|nr:uncharacterized protein HETIRDRAFT_331192 [Heterobasidion irregulare TC 32-1]ETW75326.1 hypothetical protein HETIRDRAFT_331192 [Heterobasidion irregulare TC 32-1]
MWRWHGKRYLGGAHGVAGILQIILHAPPALLYPHTAAISSTLAYLVSLQDRTGNWPSKAPARHDDQDRENDLVQWCHGAPGILPLLATALALSEPQPQPDPQPASSSHLPAPALSLPPALRPALLSALAHGAALVSARGLLRKGPGLCHGAAGNACALFCASDALGRAGAGHRAAAASAMAGGVRLLLRCVELRGTPAFGRPDRPWSLYEGEAGLCAVLAEAVERVGSVLDGAGAGAVREYGSGLVGYCDLVRV